MSFSYHIVIPARFDSQRLPGKPLLDVAGKPLIQRVYECALQSDADTITVATDNQQIFDAVEAFNGTVCMTRKDHLSGTDRVAANAVSAAATRIMPTMLNANTSR